MQLNRLALALTLALPLATLAAPGSGIVQRNFDPTVRIQDDLYMAVNGNWNKQTEIPADKTWWGAFGELRDLSESRVREIVEQAGQNGAADVEARRIADFYQSFMDEPAVEKAGLAPLRPLLDHIAGINDVTALTREFGLLQKHAVSLPINIGVGVDAKDSSRYLLEAEQSGLGMPNRDYYLQADDRMVKARTAYTDYLKQLFQLAGADETQARDKAAAVMALETRLAKLQWSSVANRDAQKTYNKLSLDGLRKTTPGFDWSVFLAGADATVGELDLNQPSYVRAAAKLINGEPVSVWRDYLTARVLDRYAPVLPQAFVDAHFRFHQQAIAGAKQIKPRWKRGIALVEKNLGEDVGKQYVARYFPAEAKAKMDTLVGNLLKAYAQSIDKLSWMSPATKAQAKDKLGKYVVKIGYPSKWRDYSGLVVKADDLLGNVDRGTEFAYRFDLAHLGKPVDRSEWGMTPQTVNAYYNPSMNEIVFPAAILQPPFFDATAEDAVNYGGIGAVIGHEISHGFDDEGSRFDGNGNLREWWQAKDRKAFAGLTGKLVNQYNAYSPLKDRRINGKLTLGENIADLSGLQIAYKAYHLSLGGQPAPELDGYKGDQRFFIGFAQVWRDKARDEAVLQGLVADPHSPSRFRAIGAAVNSDAFHATFGTKPGDGMYKRESERIRIW
ncbi:M13 family metallopeptidase [Chitinimonas arctica]|uniref:M13 family metallopeptidase n=1 Tax=Chitinimonas arctica TaxID=2594795 RepID=A0A516SJX8_9NEIS|nr:M13 family metallopeptidase [Chitinimonas arctica]QDQ28457.1 M13 family metallopeptidase [Chitinimonas arctica]